MQTDTRPIGVFDSGIGGLTVLKHLCKLMPSERFVYLGDTARVPYGNKSAETVALYSLQCAAFLQTHQVKMIVVACNTASALALQALRAHTTIPVLGVIEPAAKAAAEVTTTHHVGVIGTRATVASNSYALAVQQASGNTAIVHSMACPLFVPLVEEGWLETPATRLIVQQYISPLIASGIDTLILGCTHYPLLAPVIQEYAPGVQLIDCGTYTAREALRWLAIPETSELCAPEIFVYVTDTTPMFQHLATQFLGMPINEPVRVSIDHIEPLIGTQL